MDLKIEDVAELLNVSEKTIKKWLSTKKIPSYKINEQDFFNRHEIEDWVLNLQVNSSNLFSDHPKEIPVPELDSFSVSGKGIKQFSLYRALHKGGVLFNVPGKNRDEIIRNACQDIAPLLNLDAEILGEVLLEREHLHSTSLGQGMALPHARDLLLANHVDILVIAFPEKSIDYGALDGLPVHTLFFLFACDDRRHLNLIAKIAHLTQMPSTVKLLKSKPQKETFLDHIKNWEANL